MLSYKGSFFKRFYWLHSLVILPNQAQNAKFTSVVHTLFPTLFPKGLLMTRLSTKDQVFLSFVGMFFIVGLNWLIDETIRLLIWIPKCKKQTVGGTALKHTIGENACL